MQLQRRSPVTAAAPAAAAQRLVAPAAAAAPQHAASLRCSLRSTFPGGASISSVAALRTSAGRRSLHVAGAVGPNEKRAQIQQQRLDSLSKIDVLFDEELKALDTVSVGAADVGLPRLGGQGGAGLRAVAEAGGVVMQCSGPACMPSTYHPACPPPPRPHCPSYPYVDRTW